ncbi:MAG: bifunctional 5,10-methylenetetrahydrofolate dehydrogenase/5,10-methenyltetrahydrofolate cyclohydrolase [Pirellulaceae bacterium]|nr:bifunctional 5,10-methylenetetrahydrofolate dehydrogenase/5,10-methenyltetrahydrofolate cyclohydrolase [Pirellulaceae bacterium]MDP7014535.1 bifunctional 5,10-methylenetetrahydrofolate dehydrogenase/5,10-methenyltetrahydrofolate cyclohydrolase [Pirellulaceae bacterium]
MTARILDGKAIAAEIRAELGEQIEVFSQQTEVTPCLAAVLVGDDPASEVYVRSKRRTCEKLGMGSQLHQLPADATDDQLLALIAQLNADRAVHGILVQLPLPPQMNTQVVLDAVDAAKDVDAFHPHNVGLISQGRPRFLPCTPHGVCQILARSELPVSGRRVVILGRSEIVGKPLASMLVQKTSHLGSEYANATVTVCHSRTEDLAAISRQADVLVAAIGKASFVTAEMVQPGATVIDVGINRTENGLVGDVDFEGVKEVAGAITPVPGGVGPLTIAMVLTNTFTAARLAVQQSASA